MRRALIGLGLLAGVLGLGGCYEYDEPEYSPAYGGYQRPVYVAPPAQPYAPQYGDGYNPQPYGPYGQPYGPYGQPYGPYSRHEEHEEHDRD